MVRLSSSNNESRLSVEELTYFSVDNDINLLPGKYGFGRGVRHRFGREVFGVDRRGTWGGYSTNHGPVYSYSIF